MPTLITLPSAPRRCVVPHALMLLCLTLLCLAHTRGHAAGQGDWWMFHHDRQHTGRSAYNGPAGDMLKWSFTADSSVFSSPVIGVDGTIYVASNNANLYAIKPDGTRQWATPVGGSVEAPAIAADGTIYVGSRDYNLYAVSPSGNVLWKFPTNGLIRCAPAIAADGTIYVASYDHYLYAINPNGSKRWAFPTGDVVITRPAIGTDGTIYVGSYDHRLYAINTNGTQKWSFDTGAVVISSAAVGTDGTIYVGSQNSRLNAVNPNGTLKWYYTMGANPEVCSPAIAGDGTIYVGSHDYKLHAVNPNGSPKWTYTTGGFVESCPAIGADGTIYFGSHDHKMYALTASGALKWSHLTGDIVYSSPAIGADGTLYVGSLDSKLYAIGGNPLITPSAGPNGTISPNTPQLVAIGGNRTFTATANAGYVVDTWLVDNVAIQVGGAQFTLSSITVNHTVSVTFRVPVILGKFVNTPQVPATGVVTYTLIYNVAAKTQLANGILSDTLPANLSYVPGSATDGGSYCNGILTWFLGTLNGGASSLTHAMTFQARVNPLVSPGTQITNSASLSYDYALTRVVSNPVVVTVTSVARGDWWMFHHDPQHTGRSSYNGPHSPNVKWTFAQLGFNDMGTNPVIGGDGTIYVNGLSLFAFSPDGGKLWENIPSYLLGYGSPAIGTDGMVYVGGYQNLAAIGSNSVEHWSFHVSGSIHSSPVLGSDGTIYVGDTESGGNNLFAVNANGTQKWARNTHMSIQGSPAIGQNGWLYTPTGPCYELSGITTEYNGIYGYTPDGQRYWSPIGAGSLSSPAIGADGTVYMGSENGQVYAFYPNLALKWLYQTGDVVRSTPAIGADGVIYVGSDDHKLYALNPNGTLRWSFATGNSIRSSPALGADGTIYFGSMDNTVYALNPNGTLQWKYDTGNLIYTSPSIGADGVLYIQADNGTLFAFADPALTLVKTVDKAQASSGDAVTYSLTYGLASKGQLPGVTLTDILPAQLSYVPGSASGGGTFSNGALSWSLGDLSSNGGSTTTLTFQAIVNAGVPAGTQIINQASITSAGFQTTTVRCALLVKQSPSGRGDWWMFHHDAQHTGRSPFTGPATATPKWTQPFATGNQIWSSPVMAADGTIYIGSDDSHLYAINPDGTQKWAVPISGQMRGAPAIATDGTIYAATTDAKLYAMNPNGSLHWLYTTGDAISGSPAVGNDGTIYVGCDDHYLHAVNPDGSRKWTFTAGDQIKSSPAIGVDGTIYFGSLDQNLYAINPNGTKKWNISPGIPINSSPAIGADGAIHVATEAIFISKFGQAGPAFLMALYPDGSAKWSYRIDTTVGPSSPAIGADGTLYVGADHKLYAITANGILKWAYTTGDVIDSSPAVGADGTVYVGSRDHKLYAITANGNVASAKWTLQTGNAVESSPGIGADGTIYVGSTDNKLYAVGVPGPALSLAATVTPSYAVPGSTVTYTLTVGNTGSKPATQVALVDTLPSQISYLPNSATGGGVLSNGKLTWALGTLNAGACIRMTFQATVNNTVPANPSIDDIAAVSCAEIPTPVTRHASFIALFPVLSVTKSVSSSITPPGSQVTYTLSCTNTGNATGTNVTLADIPPQALTYVDGSATGGGVMNAGSLTWSLGSLKMGATIQVSFRARVNDAVNPHSSISNNATITCTEIPAPVVSNTATFIADYMYTVTPSAGPGGSIAPNAVQTIESGGAVTFTAIPNTGYAVATWWLDNYPVQSGGGQYQLSNVNTNHAVRVTFETIQNMRGDWWMFHHDQQHTGRSPFAGPTTANVRWAVRLLSDNSIYCSPVIGADGTIYLGADDHNLYAFTANQSFLWQFRTNNAISVGSSAAVGPDGKIYIGSELGDFYALGHDGSRRWSYQSNSLSPLTPATIGLDGTVYVGDGDHKLQAFNPDGTTIWAHPFVASDRITAAPAIGTDGTIYCGTYDCKLYAINPNGTQKWVYQASRNDYGLYSAPTIGNDGTIYFGDTENGTWCGLLYALNPNGSQKWVFRCDALIIESSAGIGADGTIYIGAGDGLHAVNPNGTQKWCYYLTYGTDSSPAIDAMGTIYFGSYDHKMYAVNPNGSLKWSFTAGGSIRTSPAISADGTLYFGTENARIYAIGGGRVHTAQPGPPAPPVAARYQPDLAIRNAGETAYTGLGTLNTTGAGQTKSQSATTGATVTYDLQLTNAGTTMDSFTLCCPLPALSGWTVQVTEQATGNDLTPAVIGAGSRSALLLPGATARYTVTITPYVDTVANVPCPLLFTATSAGDPTKQDAVKAVTTKPNTATK